MEQPKKPGANRDIADLKARLGLLKNPAPPPGAAPPVGGPGGPPFPGAPVPGGYPGAPPGYPGAPAPHPLGGAARGPMPGAAPAPSAPPPGHDPFASMKPPAGRQFDLRTVDDGVVAESVRQRGGKGIILVGLVFGLIGLAVGIGFGGASVGRREYNATNAAARKVKTELEDMQKTVTQIATAAAMSQQRLQSEKKDPSSYDPKLIEDLEKVKLDPRPDTSRIFKVNYYRLPDLAVDRLMSYYYDTISLYADVERHIKRTKADKASLDQFAARQGDRGSANYGVVFEQRGKIAIASMVEVGQPVCKDGGSECGADQITGFQIRSNTGAPWTERRISPKPEGKTVVPVDRTPLFEAVMNGSPDQVRMEQYKQRQLTIQKTLIRLAAEKKELFEEIDKASTRADLFAF